MANEIHVWHVHPWLVALVDGTLYGSNFFHEEAAKTATEKLLRGESPKEIFGWSRTEIKWSAVRSIAWVADKQTVLVHRGIWRDPWRFQTPEGETLFHELSELIPNPRAYEKQVSPNDLAMDPRVVIGVIIAIVGMIALLGGAIEGAGPAPFRGRFIAVIGEEIGVVPAMTIGVIGCLVGIGSLIWWYFKRPYKKVVCRTA